MKRKDGYLALINADHPAAHDLPEDALVTLHPEYPDVRMERRAATLLSRLMDELGGWGGIVPVSGWRTGQEQQELWDESMQEHGEAFTRQYVARPNCSEHQTGLAIDLGLQTNGMDFIRPSFPYSGVCQAFRERAAEYGFIQRYPRGKEPITGISHEPWHFRFTGIPHAAIMAERQLTLEEYHGFLKDFPVGGAPFRYDSQGKRFDIFHVPAEAVHALYKLEDSFPYMLSGDNMNGFVLTLWKR